MARTPCHPELNFPATEVAVTWWQGAEPSGELSFLIIYHLSDQVLSWVKLVPSKSNTSHIVVGMRPSRNRMLRGITHMETAKNEMSLSK